MPGEVTDAGHVDSTDVLDEYPGQDPFYLDLWSERSWSLTDIEVVLGVVLGDALPDVLPPPVEEWPD